MRPVHRADREEASERLFAELRRRADYRTHRLRPVVGALARLSDRSPLERALREGASPEELPELLRTALSVHGNADAVCTFEGIAVVLPLNAPFEAVPVREAARRRSRPRAARPPYDAIIRLLDEPFGLGFAVNLALMDRIADRIVAGEIWRCESSALRYELVETFSPERLVRTLRIGPAHADETGSLFVFGPASDPLTYVRVIDATPHPDGRPKVHWLCVPPHAATAREAVAWTFGLAGRDYHPTVESRGRIVPLGSKVVLRCL